MLQIEKKELRDRFVRERNDIPATIRREYSDDIFECIRSLVRYKISRLILVFVSAGSEPETHRFIETALSDGKKVAVPYISEGEMSFRYIGSLSELVPGAFGISEPPAGNETVKDFSSCLCVTPCLSVDENGVRLGYGGGFYDRFLSEHSGVYAAAVCFDELISRELPCENHDIRVDMYVTQTKCKEVS